MVHINFDANQYEPSTSFVPLPAGKYLAVITSTEMKPTKNGAGQYLMVEYQVIDGEHKGRRVWSRHTIHHPNEEAEKIAREELSAICYAVGVILKQDTSELHNLPMLITVRVKNREDNGDPTNEVSGWAKKEAATGAPQQATPPWARRQ